MHLEGHILPAGRVFKTPNLNGWLDFKHGCDFLATAPVV